MIASAQQLRNFGLQSRHLPSTIATLACTGAAAAFSSMMRLVHHDANDGLRTVVRFLSARKEDDRKERELTPSHEDALPSFVDGRWWQLAE